MSILAQLSQRVPPAGPAGGVIFVIVFTAFTLRWRIWLLSKSLRRETTLLPPLLWAIFALTCVAIVAATSVAATGNFCSRFSAPLCFMAAVTTFCPGMAVLGAKRPQHFAWQWVVLSLWCITALPALESLAISPDGLLKITVVRGWFLWALILLGLCVYLPTRCALSALLVAYAQVLLLWPWLPLLRSPTSLSADVWALIALLAAVWLVPKKFAKASGANSLWLDFRDLFGALWGVRVLERINAAAEVGKWPCLLTWTGFVDRESGRPFDAAQLPAHISQPLRQTMINLVRRFADEAWIDRRWPPR